MSVGRLVFVQARYILLARSREPRAIVFTVAFPFFFLVIFNSIFNTTRPIDLGGGLKVDPKAYFTAGIIAYATALSTFTTLAMVLTTQRESGQLKRFRGTPMPPWTFVAGQICAAIVQVIAMAAMLMAVGKIAYGVPLPHSTAVGFIIYVLLGAATFCAMGMALTVFTPSADAAGAIGPFSVVVLSFISGVFVPIDTLPNWLAQIGRIFPLYHLADGLQRTLVPGASGLGLSADNVLVLGIWGVGAVFLAARRFHWEPQASRG
ncbi:MAG: ABC transporter permease [Solirubrobacterales bacterium]